MQGNRCQEMHDHSDMEWLERIEVETERRTVLRPIGRNFISWDNRLAKDVEYVENLNFMMDIRVLLKTVEVVLKKEDVVVATDAVECYLWEEREARVDDQ